ncbi:MAG TPA: hypothetical protein VFS43_36360 [Polyangiaceae bacterium]|nr:hypothetical protein [Polyangiaceae bacterium]
MTIFAAFAWPRRVLALTLASLLALPACLVVTDDDDDDGRACTEKGCADGFVLTLAHAGGWPAGAYRFEVVADGKTITCSASLPLPPCGQGPASACDAPELTLGLSGCALPAAEHGFSELYWTTTTPASVSVEVTRDGAPLAQTQLTPTYVTSQPNGPDCGPSCRNASASMAVP